MHDRLMYSLAMNDTDEENQELKDLLKSTSRIEFDNGYTVYRGGIAYEIEGDPEPLCYRSIPSAYKAIKRRFLPDEDDDNV